MSDNVLWIHDPQTLTVCDEYVYALCDINGDARSQAVLTLFRHRLFPGYPRISPMDLGPSSSLSRASDVVVEFCLCARDSRELALDDPAGSELWPCGCPSRPRATKSGVSPQTVRPLGEHIPVTTRSQSVNTATKRWLLMHRAPGARESVVSPTPMFRYESSGIQTGEAMELRRSISRALTSGR